MEFLKDIIQRCHQRHKAVLRQRQTVVTAALYKHIPYDFNVRCARATLLTLDALEQAHISFMPIGRAPENEDGPRDFGGDRFLKRQGREDWLYKRLFESWGIQIYTGIPSARDGANWHDLYFSYEAICAVPDAVLTCLEALVMMTTNPLLTLTKSGGLRFSCRIPDYLHPNADATKNYIYKPTPTPEDPHHRDVYLEIRGERGYSRWDTRYEILAGDLLAPPVIAKEMLFVPIDAFRAALHEPYLFEEGRVESVPEPAAVPASLGSDDLDLAKAAFLKRGFCYLREDIGFHHWILRDSEGDDTHASLWEDRGIVWVRTSTPPTAPATGAVPITDLWDDTGIALPTSDPRLPLTDAMIAVKENRISPLAIKRPGPVLPGGKSTEVVYATPKEHADEIQSVLEEKKARVLGVISEAASGTDVVVESYLRAGGATCLNVANRVLVEAAEARYEALNLPSFARWRARMYRWHRAKNVPVEERMANPFQHGNVCEDPERCRALEAKGGSPQESICPKCPVYEACQERGYLSQPMALRRAKAQISPVSQIFLDPRRSESFKRIFESTDGSERICIIDENDMDLSQLFIECVLPIDVLKKWAMSWQGRALGNYANALLNVLAPQSVSDGSAIARIRTATDGFQQHEEEIIRQMCHVNVRGKVMACEPVVDAESGEELAHWTIAFAGGSSAYIPVDTEAEDRLKEKGLACFSLRSFTPDEDMEIPISMEEAIALGILDVETVEKIQEFPTVYRNPNWTLWHQLKRFFAHYKRDADAPMRWNASILRFGMPPMLHPDIKRLLLISPTVSEDYLHKVFPNDEIEIVRTKPTAWVPGNRVFQLRSGIYSQDVILNRKSDWDVDGLSKLGERFCSGIRLEIERDPTVKHGVLTNIGIAKQLKDIAAKENVSFVGSFGDIDSVDAAIEDVQVLWIVGMPHWLQKTIWWLAQVLFGNDAEALSYEAEIKLGHFKDERIRAIYHQCVVDSLTKVVGRARLNVWSDKTVMLLTGLALPNISDRPETLLFDWEDFQIAGGLHNLPETIRIREQFEAERDALTGDSRRADVERIFSCSSRQANRILQKIRGGNIQRVSFRDQILFLLSSGSEKKVSSIIAAIDSSPQSIGNELTRLVHTGEIVRVRRGVYALPKE